jgi:hypothetical protein
VSIHFDILDNLRDRLVFVDPSIPVIIRKKSVLLQTDTTPIIILSPGKVTNSNDYFEKVVQRVYPVHLSYIRPGDRDYSEEECSRILDIEEKLREEVFQPLTEIETGLPEDQGVDCNMDEKPPFEVASGDRNNYDISGYVIRYTLFELRKT